MGRLLVGAAVGVGESEGINRIRTLEKAGVDVIVIDTAHGHSENVIWEKLKKFKKKFPKLPVVVGKMLQRKQQKNFKTKWADALKVGIGPGSICTTRIIAGVGVPQLHAISETFKIAKKNNIPIISDGGIKYSGDIAKAIAFGADVVMIGSLFAGTDENHLEKYFYPKGKNIQIIRGKQVTRRYGKWFSR
ncbi:MAG: hypothetical protein CM15mP40_07710 [Alphaproteobacteria bacterium]|nr:MAG: hypothetical protein CM15mP40_07710 [Alphaproteobacteria bacterium]